MAFKKYPVLYDLEIRHGVDLGQSHKTKDSAKTFITYIAQNQREEFVHSLTKSTRFYSFLMDGSTDVGNVENELIVVLYCKKDVEAQEMKLYTRYFSIQVPHKADANGLIECLG